MEAIVLAGGDGTRMGQLTQNTPKQLLQVGGTYLINYSLKVLLNSQNIDRILLSVQEKYKEKYVRLIGNGTDKVTIDYNTIKDPNIIEVLRKNTELLKSDSFVLLLGDSILDINLDKVIDFYRLNDEKYNIVIVAPKKVQLLGVKIRGKLIKSLFKISKEDYEVCGAILNKKDINWNVKGDYLESIYDDLAKRNKLKLYKFFGYYKNINTKKDLVDADDDIKNGKVSLSWIF